MRNTTLTTLSFSLACVLALSGCGPSADKSSAPAVKPSAPAQASAAPQAATQKSFDSPMKPGLWELTMQSDMMKQMPQPKISPQQAEQMRKMGISVPDQRAGGMVMKVCYTKEMLAEKEVPTPNDQECKPTNMSRSGNSFSATTVCSGPNMKGTGTVQGTMSDTAYELNSSFKGTMGGEPVDHKSQMTGKFISADCGTTKPLMMPK